MFDCVNTVMENNLQNYSQEDEEEIPVEIPRTVVKVEPIYPEDDEEINFQVPPPIVKVEPADPEDYEQPLKVDLPGEGANEDEIVTDDYHPQIQVFVPKAEPLEHYEKEGAENSVPPVRDKSVKEEIQPRDKSAVVGDKINVHMPASGKYERYYAFSSKIIKKKGKHKSTSSVKGTDKRCKSKVEKKPFICDICGKETSRKQNLYYHILIHLGERPHKCKICPKTFTQLSALKTHEKFHLGDRKFSCDTCSKSYITQSDLTKHQKIHKKEWSVLCDICGKGFTCKSNLLVHSRIHTGLKPYQCTKCNLSFRDKSNLRRHSVIHLKVKPYLCQVCGKSFTQSGTLKRHVCVAQEVISV